MTVLPLLLYCLPTRASDAAIGEVSMGTTIIAAKYEHGVILAADSRTSISNYASNRHASKINILFDDSNKNGDCACICRAGSAADTQHLVEILKEDLHSRLHRRNIVGRNAKANVTVKSCARLIRTILLESSTDKSCNLICAGYDSSAGEGVLYSILQTGAMFDMSAEGVITSGSGSTFVQGFIDDNYHSNMTEAECVRFLAKAVRLSMDRDGHSGGNAR